MPLIIAHLLLPMRWWWRVAFLMICKTFGDRVLGRGSSKVIYFRVSMVYDLEGMLPCVQTVTLLAGIVSGGAVQVAQVKNCNAFFYVNVSRCTRIGGNEYFGWWMGWLSSQLLWPEWQWALSILELTHPGKWKVLLACTCQKSFVRKWISSHRIPRVCLALVAISIYVAGTVAILVHSWALGGGGGFVKVMPLSTSIDD